MYCPNFVLQARAGYEREFKAELQKLRGVEADISEEEAEIQVNMKPFFFLSYCVLFLILFLMFISALYNHNA